LYLFVNQNFTVLKLNDRKGDSTFSYADDTVKVKDILANYTPVLLKNKFYFIQNEGGGVYEFNQRKFDRIDYSSTHRMQAASSIFVHADTIFRYGGYGFFSSRDFFTYFNLETKEWEVYSPVNSDQIPIGTSDNFFIYAHNTIYLFCGKYNNPKNRREFKELNEVWKFNFIDHTWTMMGTLIPRELNSMGFQVRDHFLMPYRHNYYLIDLITNKLSLFKGNSYAMKTFFAPSPIYFDGKFYFCNSIGQRDEQELIVNSEAEFMGDFINSQTMYDDHSLRLLIYNILTFLGLTMAVFVGFNFIRRRSDRKRLLVIKGFTIHYRDKKTEMDAVSIAVIRKLLIANHSGVSGTDLLEITERKELHFNHNIRERNSILSELNFRLKTLTNLNEDIIVTEKSAQDNRLKIYRIRHELFAPI
jgi:hypothetical protein